MKKAALLSVILLTLSCVQNEKRAAQKKDIKTLEIVDIGWSNYIVEGDQYQGLEWFGIKNYLDSKIVEVELLFTLKDAQGKKLTELEYLPLPTNTYIEPLDTYHILAGYGSLYQELDVGKRRTGEKLEIEIIGYTVKKFRSYQSQ